MPKFLAKLFNNRKSWICFVAIALLFVIIPETTLAGCAQGAAAGAVAGGVASWWMGPGVLIGAAVGAASGCLIGWLGGQAIDTVVQQIFGGVTWAIGNLIFYLFKSIAELAASLYDNVVVKMMNVPITQNAVFVEAWQTMRDFANMVIVLGFVIVGIGTTLRLNSFKTNQIFINLISIALLINFSGLICGLIIDGSNVITGFFMGKAGANVATTIVDNITFMSSNFFAIKQNSAGYALANADWSNYLAGLAEFCAMYLIVSFVFFRLVGLIFERVVRFAALFILSPLAFAAYIFPYTRNKYFTVWLNDFIKWAFVGASVALFLWVGGKTLEAANKNAMAAQRQPSYYQNAPQNSDQNNPPATNVAVAGLSGAAKNIIDNNNDSATEQVALQDKQVAIQDNQIAQGGGTSGVATGAGGAPIGPGIFDLFIVLGFFYMAEKTGKAAGSMMGDAVLGLAKGGMGMALGAVGAGAVAGTLLGSEGAKGAAKGAGYRKELVKQTGQTSLGNRAIQQLENFGLVKAGTAANMNQANLKLIEDSSKRLSNAFGDNAEDNAKLAKVAETGNSRDRAAAYQLLAQRKATSLISADKRERSAANARAYGVSKDLISKENPEFGTNITDKDVKEKLINEEAVRLEGMNISKEKALELARKNYKPNATAIESTKREMVKQKVQERKVGYSGPSKEDIIREARESYAPTAAEIAAKKAEINAANRKLGMSGVNALPATDAQAIELLRSGYNPSTTDAAQINERLTRERMQEKALGFSYATKEDARQNLIDEEMARLKASGVMAKDINSGIDSFIKNSVNNNTIAQRKAKMDTERKAKAIKKMGVQKLRDLQTEGIDSDIVEHSDYGTFEKAYSEFTTEQKDKYRTLASGVAGMITSQLGIPAGSTLGDVKAEIKALESSANAADREKARTAKSLANKWLLIR